MQNELCELVVSVYVYSFFNETVEFSFLRDSLERIDKLTFKYKTPQEFFTDNQRYITSRVADMFEREKGYSPTGYELGENGIYVLKHGRKISPLYETIQGYPIEDVVTKYLFDGNILVFYKCDKRRKARNENYKSFFEDFTQESIDCLECGMIRKTDVRYILSEIMLSTRIYPTIRFLLGSMKGKNFSDLYQQFCELIPEKEAAIKERERDDDNNFQERVYRYPYNDDN